MAIVPLLPLLNGLIIGEMKKACFITTLSIYGKGHRQRLRPLKEFYDRQGWDTCWTNPSAEDKEKQLKDCDHVYIWNGSDDASRDISWFARSLGSRLFCMENGHFPQGEYNIIAEGGLYGRHPGLNEDWDSILCESDWTKFKEARLKLEIWRNPIRNVLVPIQVDSDVTVVKYGNGYTNKDLVSADLGFDKWIRNHPKGRRYSRDAHTDDRPNLKQVLGSYDHVFGINSTVIYEAKLMGLDVTALGQSYLDWHVDPDVSICALFAMQIPINTEDFSPWIRRGLGLDHLLHL